MLNELHSQQVEVSAKIEPDITHGPEPANEFVGAPEASMPIGYGQIQPAGIGDLLLVREHVKAYEGGEIAHTENVLQERVPLARDPPSGTHRNDRPAGNRKRPRKKNGTPRPRNAPR